MLSWVMSPPTKWMSISLLLSSSCRFGVKPQLRTRTITCDNIPYEGVLVAVQGSNNFALI